MSEVNYIKKDKKNNFQNYEYASEEAIKDKIHDLLVKNKVVFKLDCKFVNDVAEQIGEVVTGMPNNGSQKTTSYSHFVNAQFDYTFFDVDSGESMTGQFAGSGQDKGDKGLYKAITGALKYIMTSTFVIPTGTDPEDDGGKVSNGQNSTKSVAQKPPANKPSVIPPKPPEKPLKTKEDLLREEVKKLCDEIGLSTLTILKTKEDYEKFVKEKTGFKLEPAFHSMILTRLKSIKSANEFEKDLAEPIKS